MPPNLSLSIGTWSGRRSGKPPRLCDNGKVAIRRTCAGSGRSFDGGLWIGSAADLEQAKFVASLTAVRGESHRRELQYNGCFVLISVAVSPGIRVFGLWVADCWGAGRKRSIRRAAGAKLRKVCERNQTTLYFSVDGDLPSFAIIARRVFFNS